MCVISVRTLTLIAHSLSHCAHTHTHTHEISNKWTKTDMESPNIVWTNMLYMHEHVMTLMLVCACQQKMAKMIYAQNVKAKGQDIHKCKCCVERGGLTLNIHTHTHTHTHKHTHIVWTHTLEAALMDVAYTYEWLIKPFSVCTCVCVCRLDCTHSLNTESCHSRSAPNFSHYRWNEWAVPTQTQAHSLWLHRNGMLIIHNVTQYVQLLYMCIYFSCQTVYYQLCLAKCISPLLYINSENVNKISSGPSVEHMNASSCLNSTSEELP